VPKLRLGYAKREAELGDEVEAELHSKLVTKQSLVTRGKQSFTASSSPSRAW